MSRSEKRKSQTKKGILLGLGAIALVIVGGYAVRSAHYSSRFLPNTTASGVDISNLTVKEANQKLKNKLTDASFTIKIDGNDWKTIQRSTIENKSNFTSDLKELKSSQNPLSWGMQLVSADTTSDVASTTVSQEKLTAVSDEIKTELEGVNAVRTAATNATIEQDDSGDFKIVAETDGNQIDSAKAVAAFEKAISNGKSKIDLTSYVATAAVTKDSKKLKNALSKIETIANINATYSINGENLQIPKATIKSWLTTDDEGNVSLDQDQVTTYVTELGTKYNTSTNPTNFASTLRGTVSIPAGSYSWSIATNAEVEALTAEILKGKDFTRSPEVTGATTADHALIGNTYVEVDLVNQHMWYYKDGSLVLDTDIVSGKPSSATPTGVNYIWSKQRNATLTGENYSTPVSYWMPVDWTGVGIHDSSWQSSYGGTRYLTNGSHGCINTPPSVVATLYNAVEVGTPVLIF